MCGITGWVDFERDLRGEIPQIIEMTNKLAHRGPDSEGIWGRKHVLFGHRRLAVIDLEGGKQPFEKSGYVIIYNGELYNTDSLREQLKKCGHTFSTTSDTEVLLTAFIEWKEECIAYLDGIFAFAIWNIEKESLFLCRDRLGVKPLFYKETAAGLLFGSEIKALLAHKEVPAEVSLSGLTALLSMGPSRIIGDGIFNGVKELKPGHAMVVKKHQKTIWRYWTVRQCEHTHSIDETAEHVRELVTQAIQKQLVSDVPLCTFLSGGVDSSIITAIAASAAPLATYSVGYEDNHRYFQKNAFQTTEDVYWINLMSEAFNTKHKEVLLPQEELITHLEQAMLHKDMPSMADIDSSLYLFSREIKKDFTVALSGECADELFGGYPWFYEDYTSFPWIRSIKAREQLLNVDWRERLQLSSFLEETFHHAVNEAPAMTGTASEVRHQQLFYLNQQYFMQTLLERKDRMTMAQGLEVRVPFADHALVEYVWNIPWEMKHINNQEKGILRKAFEGIVPDEVLHRKKNPYPKTYHPHYTEGVQKLLKELLQNKDSILHELFEKNKIEALVNSGGDSFDVPWFGQLMAGPQLLAYFIQFHLWFERYRINIV
ncbi:MAG: asparagine synthase (glutamine-hydrolyzing) [Solibacillus sp.]